eukprot:6203535-Pyramimonas_sp.AAC.1
MTPETPDMGAESQQHSRIGVVSPQIGGGSPPCFDPTKSASLRRRETAGRWLSESGDQEIRGGSERGGGGE